MIENDLLRILTGGWVAQATSVAARIGLPDALSAGPSDAAALSRGLGVDSRALARLLRLLTAAGLLEENGEAYTLTEMGALLRRENLGPLAALYGSDYFMASWAALEHSVTTGEQAFTHVHGTPVFDYLAGRPDRSGEFHAGMAAGTLYFRRVPDVHDFTGARAVVDVGGGTGALLAEILRRAPHTRGVLFDVPDVIATAGRALEDVADRCHLVGGDMFASVPDGGDTYLLSRILHDWDDEQCATILGNLAKAMPPGAKLLVIERVVSADALLPAAFDLHMMVMTGGRERTLPELHAMLIRAGLTPASVTDLPLGMRLLTAVLETS
ncbi:methyltransferase [Nonomuraea typhae]|uniref:methyltransferase n=1 Tax=Nonomuraea typhae TaxID=2603600 RepID=UPI0012FACCEF|nr:methyltransferase [Nonomuraea typhae]